MPFRKRYLQTEMATGWMGGAAGRDLWNPLLPMGKSTGLPKLVSILGWGCFMQASDLYLPSLVGSRCRNQKMKCVREPAPEETSTTPLSASACRGCLSVGVPCVYEAPRRRLRALPPITSIQTNIYPPPSSNLRTTAPSTIHQPTDNHLPALLVPPISTLFPPQSSFALAERVYSLEEEVAELKSILIHLMSSSSAYSGPEGKPSGKLRFSPGSTIHPPNQSRFAYQTPASPYPNSTPPPSSRQVVSPLAAFMRDQDSHRARPDSVSEPSEITSIPSPNKHPQPTQGGNGLSVRPLEGDLVERGIISEQNAQRGMCPLCFCPWSS